MEIEQNYVQVEILVGNIGFNLNLKYFHQK